VLVQPLVLPSGEQYERGVHVVVVGVEKAGGGLVDPGIKTGNYLNNILALQQAIARGGDDAILCSGSGDIAEGATSNVFLVQGGAILTPHLETGLLAGITREAVFELATELGQPPVETRLQPDDLYRADELFLTSSVRGIMPVTRIDGRPVGDGAVGPTTRALMDRYERYLTAWAASC
jgi:branched-chain amino acid aminotransferase